MGPKIDVVIPIERGHELSPAARDALLDQGDVLGEIVVPVDGADGFFREPRRNDVLLLHPDALLLPGCLAELRAVADGDERLGCLSPVVIGTPDAKAAREATQALPRITWTPEVALAGAYFRRTVIDLCGAPNAPDWLWRAQRLGFISARANHAWFCAGPAQPRPLGDSFLDLEARRFRAGLDAKLTDHALRVQASGKLRVALDLRHLPRHPVGTSVYAMSLAVSLARSREVDLTLVVRDALLSELNARVVRQERRLDDIEVLHKPAQVFDPGDLELLFSSPAHTVISHQDLIAHHAQPLFTDEQQAYDYRALSYAVLHAAQGVIVFSASTHRELAREYQLPLDEISVVPHGIDRARWQGAPAEPPRSLPERYFLFAGTDYPHKNLELLVEAHQLARSQSSDAEFPSLVLTGASAGLPDGVYDRLRRRPLDGVVHLGAIAEGQLMSVYRGAEALVFPSTYEGFGLPPIEAMAAGVPVIALPLSAVAEVCGDAALYPDGNRAADLAAALQSLASTPSLRAKLVAAGARRVAEFTVEKTLAGTVATYRRAVRAPSERSLAARRNLRRPDGDLGLGAEYRRVQEQLQKVNRSASFRIGMAMTAPLRWLLSSRR